MSTRVTNQTISGSKRVKLHDLETDEAKGIVVAAFARLNVIDHDGDVLVPGELRPGSVAMSDYNHFSNFGTALPVGRGSIKEDGDLAIAELRMFMGIQRARDVFVTITEMDDLQEYSYGFNAEFEQGVFDGEPAYYMRNVEVHEVSPVLRGAGIDTHTVSVKSLADRTDEDAWRLLRELSVDLKRRGATPDEIAEVLASQEKSTTPEADFGGAGLLALVGAQRGWLNDNEERERT
jgi:hypothetical protein